MTTPKAPCFKCGYKGEVFLEVYPLDEKRWICQTCDRETGEDIEQRIKGGQIVDTGLCDGKREPMTDEEIADWAGISKFKEMNTDKIKINTDTFNFMTKLIFTNCKKTDIDKLTKMLKKETSVPSKLIYEESI